MSKVDPFSTRSTNSVKINNIKKEIPFCTRFYNRPSVTTATDSPTCTNDYFAEQCDINVIVANHTISGTPLPSIEKALYNMDENGNLIGEVHSQYTNFTDRFLAAKANFMTLPPELRAMYDNDVTQFAQYLNKASDDDILQLMKQYKLAKEDLTPAVGSQDIEPQINPSGTTDTQSVSPEG